MTIKRLLGLILFILPALQMLPQDNTDVVNIKSIDYTDISLPSLETLYENAQKTPDIEIFENLKKIQQRLLSKEKRGWLNFFSLRGGYTYGKTDNYGSISDVTTPIFYQYTGVSQNYYNVGGNISIPLESLFDVKGKIKRQKLAVENAELEKQKALQELKKEIATLYVQILSYISSLKIAGEAVSMAQATYSVKEKEFQAGNGSATELLSVKRQQVELSQTYENTRALLSSSLYVLEIISNTPIISVLEK